MAGKGSKRRPTNDKEFGKNYDNIFKRKKTNGKAKENKQSTIAKASGSSDGDTNVTIKADKGSTSIGFQN